MKILLMLLLGVSFAIAKGKKEGGSMESALHPNVANQFNDLPADAREFFKRSFSCGEYSSLEIGDPTPEQLKDAQEKMRRLKCDDIQGDARRIREKYKNDRKIQDAFHRLAEAG